MVRESIPFGNKCICECGAGIASKQDADALVISSISNWGAYVFAALLSYLSRINFPHSVSLEKEFILISSKLGMVDGFTGRPSKSVDGIPMEIDLDLVKFLVRVLQHFQGNLH
jgi:hypothetical protein